MNYGPEPFDQQCMHATFFNTAKTANLSHTKCQMQNAKFGNEKSVDDMMATKKMHGLG
jgi:hypothetical protein